MIALSWTLNDMPAGIGCVLLFLAIAGVWLRGCIALEHDVGSWGKVTKTR